MGQAREEVGHVLERGRVEAPGAAGELHRALEGQIERAQVGAGAAGGEHAPIEARVVRGDEIDPVEEGEQRGPELGEGGLARDTAPVDPVQVGELEDARGRADEPAGALGDAPLVHAHQGEGAGAVALATGRLEVEGDEGGQAGRSRGRRS